MNGLVYGIAPQTLKLFIAAPPLIDQTFYFTDSPFFTKIPATQQLQDTEPITKMSKTHFVTFLSEGAPHDKGLDLKGNLPLLLEACEGHFDNVTYYTPRKLRKEGYERYVKEHSEQGLVTQNPGMSKIGFCAWRPLILLLELNKLSSDDILVYRDANILKYPNLGKFNNVGKNARALLDLCNFDFFVSLHDFNIKAKQLTKTNVLRELGEDHPFSYEFPALMSGNIVIRKSERSIELISEWLKACEKETWINGIQYGELDPSFSHFTPEQSILTVIIANWVRKRKQDIPLTYPHIFLTERSCLNSVQFYKDLSYLSLLDTSVEVKKLESFQTNVCTKELVLMAKFLIKRFWVKKRLKLWSSALRFLPASTCLQRKVEANQSLYESMKI